MTALPAFDLEGPDAWRSSELGPTERWVEHWQPEEIAELEAAVERVVASGRAGGVLRAEDFALPRCKERIAGWFAELEHGRGFCLVRGLPVTRWGDERAALAYLGLGLQMGGIQSQNAAGDRLGHIRDVGADPDDPAVRLYKTRVAQPLHTDGADVIGLLCLRTAQSGGTSQIVSSVAVYRALAERRPDLAALLFEPFHFDRNEEQAAGEPPSFAIPICRREGDKVRTFYVGWYIRDAQRHASVPRLTDQQRELLDLYDAIAASPELRLDMEFVPGDIQWLKNASILHGRTAYEDAGPPESRRHLLRLWVRADSAQLGADPRVREVPRKEGVASDAAALAGNEAR
ncbi:MAG: TauD/TfdA family dioxygenase [Myxococcota bacterium]